MHPILFPTREIALIRNGRKTQTRRLVTSPLSACVPGDRLWLQEAFSPSADADCAIMRDGWRQYRDGRGVQGPAPDNSFGRLIWRQAVHMPRWASRLTLVIERVRTERLHDMTNGDAIAEGMARWSLLWASPRARFRKYWQATRGTAGERWDDNPSVIVLDFHTAH